MEESDPGPFCSENDHAMEFSHNDEKKGVTVLKCKRAGCSHTEEYRP